MDKETEEEIVKEFGKAMLAKIIKRRARYKEKGWRDPDYKTVIKLREHLDVEIEEWHQAFGDEELDELVDVANSAMMIWDRIKNDRNI